MAMGKWTGMGTGMGIEMAKVFVRGVWDGMEFV